jgi:muramoyltetrapeptide carboxypeptidase
MLNQGDTIGIIALSGNCDREKVDKAKENIEALGHKVVLSKNIYDKNRYLAGSDEDKIKELHRFFENNEIKLILCARGGYGAIRLINKIDYELIKANPKPFCGFSDVTALLLMIYKKTGIITYHSPMACTDFNKGEANIPSPQPSPEGRGGSRQFVSGSEYSVQNFFDAINNATMSCKGTKIYANGVAEGILWGGNLATVVSLCGQDFIPDKDFIFFTEDLNEPVYKIDKMFQQLINIPEFKKYCKGIVLGDFLEVDNKEWLEEYFSELASRLNLPLIGGFKITHAEEKITLPIGKMAVLNGIELQIS